MAEARRLAGKTAIVTGGGSGFGAGIVRTFAAEGAEIVVADVNAKAAEAVAAEFGGVAQLTDVSDDASVAELTRVAMQALGRIDILVNNAGITHLPMPLEDVPEDEFDRIFAVNAKSVYLTARHVVPLMKQAGSGAILNIASTAGPQPTAKAQLVQRLQGLDDHRDQGDGGGAGAEWHPRQCAGPGRRGDAAARQLHGTRTRRKCGRSSSPRFRSAASRRPPTWARRRRSSAPIMPR